MNSQLAQLAETAGLNGPGGEPLRLAFGLACAQRIRHLLEDERATAAVGALELFLRGELARVDFDAVARGMGEVAASHQGSHSLDGAGHAAVSATHAVTHALQGHALESAAYAAYAAVYAYAGHAINDPDAFAEEFAWQTGCLRRLRACQV